MSEEIGTELLETLKGIKGAGQAATEMFIKLESSLTDEQIELMHTSLEAFYQWGKSEGYHEGIYDGLNK